MVSLHTYPRGPQPIPTTAEGVLLETMLIGIAEYLWVEPIHTTVWPFINNNAILRYDHIGKYGVVLP
eukprot:12922661-Prorocentrum_lima.AAC.1